jgi:hypothetical protein
MKRNQHVAQPSEKYVVCTVAASLILCAFCFTEESSAKSKGPYENLKLCCLTYFTSSLPPGVTFQQPEADSGVSFPGNPLQVGVADLDVDGPLDVSTLPKLPPAGGSVDVTAPVGIDLQLVVGPSQIPVDIKTHTDLSFRTTNPNSPGQTIEPYDLEITGFTIQGIIPFNGGLTPFVLRESPTLASLGQFSSTPLSDGSLAVTSFFDIFFELSLNNGPFIPADGPFHLVLTGQVPEPGTIVSAAIGCAGLGLLVTRQRRRR